MAGSFFTRRFAYSGSSCTLEQPGSQWGEIISELNRRIKCKKWTRLSFDPFLLQMDGLKMV